MCFGECSAPFTMVARWTGGNQIFPPMYAAQSSWQHVIDCHTVAPLPAVLAGMIVPTQYFSFGESDPWTRTMDHIRQPNDRGAQKGNGRRPLRIISALCVISSPIARLVLQTWRGS